MSNPDIKSQLWQALRRIEAYLPLLVSRAPRADLTELTALARYDEAAGWFLRNDGLNWSWRERIKHKLAPRLFWRQIIFNDKVARLAQEARYAQGVDTEAGRPRFLFVVPYDVSGSITGGSSRIWGISSELARTADVRILMLGNSTRDCVRYHIAPAVEMIAVSMGKAVERKIAEEEGRYGHSSGLMLLPRVFNELPLFREVLEIQVRWANVVALDGPYLFPLIREFLGKTPFIYESPNFTPAFVREISGGKVSADEVVSLERPAIERADRVWCVGEEDRKSIVSQYGVTEDAVTVCPNGVDADAAVCVTPLMLPGIRRHCGWDRDSVMFVGTELQANVEAAIFILDQLAATMTDTVFIFVGMEERHVRARGWKGTVPSNVLFLGKLSQNHKEAITALVDVAVAPMMSGTGSSLKIPDYVAHGKPVLATPLALRGYPRLGEWVRFAEPAAFPGALREMLAELESSPDAWDKKCRAARTWVEAHLTWRQIAKPERSWIENMSKRRTAGDHA